MLNTTGRVQTRRASAAMGNPTPIPERRGGPADDSTIREDNGDTRPEGSPNNDTHDDADTIPIPKNYIDISVSARLHFSPASDVISIQAAKFTDIDTNQVEFETTGEFFVRTIPKELIEILTTVTVPPTSSAMYMTALDASKSFPDPVADGERFRVTIPTQPRITRGPPASFKPYKLDVFFQTLEEAKGFVDSYNSQLIQ